MAQFGVEMHMFLQVSTSGTEYEDMVELFANMSGSAQSKMECNLE